MLTYRSRNHLSNSINLNKSLSSNTIEEKIYPKNKILTNLTECAGEARIIIQNNNSLKQKISILKINNLYTKNYISKIIAINKDIKFKQKKNNNNNSSNYHLYKDNIYNFIKEYNELIKKNNNILKEKVQKEKEKNENHKNNLELQINNLNEILEENLNLNFLLENKNKYKESIIKDLTQSNENIGCIQEITRYRFINDEMSQSDIDKYFSKYLSVFQQSLLNITQNWNKHKNRAIKFEQEKKALLKIMENPENFEENEKNDNEKKDDKYIDTNENELFLLTFDEFEDESSMEVTLETENIPTNQNDENNISKNSSINKNNNYIKINNNFNKINTNNKHNKINNIKNQNITNKRINKMNFLKREIYYIPQKDFSRSLIKNSESMKKVNHNGSININICSKIPKTNRNISINNISKLNLKQIVFNKKKKFLKEEAKEIAIKRYKVENEYNMNISNNNLENLNDVKIQMEIKEIKKDIKRFKEKIMRKKKIIKEFKLFCKDILKKYDLYINNNNDNIQRKNTNN